MNYASSGTGSQYHLAGELFKTMSGTDIVHVPYKGSTGARNDILGGQVQMMFDTIATMGPSVEAGLVHALGTTGRRALPDPSRRADDRGSRRCRASGRPAGSASWRRPRRRNRSSTASTRRSARSSPRPRSRRCWAKQGVVPLSMTARKFGAFIKAEIDKWAKVAQTAGVKIN